MLVCVSVHGNEDSTHSSEWSALQKASLNSQGQCHTHEIVRSMLHIVVLSPTYHSSLISPELRILGYQDSKNAYL